MKKMLVIGVSSYDTLIHVHEINEIKEDMSLWAKKVIYAVGGTGAGKALALNQLGIKSKLITELGNDDEKVHILNEFEKHKIDYKILKADQTTKHTNIMHSNGKRLSIFTGIATKVDYDLSVEKDIIDADVIFLNINQYCVDYIPLIKKHKKLVVVDIHDYNINNPYHEPFIECADILFLSGVNIKDQKEFLYSYIKDRVAVVITNAEKGSIGIDQNMKIISQDAYRELPFIDSNGAGDSYSAGFIYQYLLTKDLKRAMAFASVCGGYACSSDYIFSKEMGIDSISKILDKR